MKNDKELSKYYLLSLISNINSGFSPKNKDELGINIKRIGSCLNDLKKTEIGEWKVVWGPCVQFTKATVRGESRYITDNAMYVAKSANEETYFVGVSGTNGQSHSGWFDQDFDVTGMETYPRGAEDDSKISMGAYKGLEKLQGMKDAVTKQSLIEFLQTKVVGEDQRKLVIGGHSLGGCLAPVLAAEVASKVEKGSLSIEVYPTAGPTPGNQAFADHLASVVSKYHAVNNENDLVPQAWDFQGLDTLLDNYKGWKFGSKEIDPSSPLIKLWMNWARNYVSDKGYARKPSVEKENFLVETWSNQLIPNIQLWEKNMTGAVIEVFTREILASRKVSKQMKRIYKQSNRKAYREFSRFLLQVGMQHVPAYSHSSSGAGIGPIFLSEELRTIIKPYFKKSSSTKTKWKKGLTIQLFTELTSKIADWYEKHPSYLNEVDTITLEEDDESLEVTPELEAEFNAIMDEKDDEQVENRLKDLGIDTDLMPWNQSPFNF